MEKTDDGKNLLNKGSFALLMGILMGTFWCVLPAAAQESVCAEVQIEIAQELTLERQAFEAHMRINNGLSTITLEDVQVTVNFLDEDGNPVTATADPTVDLDTTPVPFFIRFESAANFPVDQETLDFTGTVAPSTSADIYWLIIPTLAASDNPDGTLYYVGATLSYTIGGEPNTVEVIPDYIFVKPLPELRLDYFWPSEVYGDDAWIGEIESLVAFSVGVRVGNQGFGTAYNLQIDSAQPTIVEDEQGLLIDFLIMGSEVNGQPATPSLLADFGDIAPNTSGVARWNMTCSLSGTFEDFTADYTHADELGGELTSVIRAVNPHYLVRDVLVDLPGRDGIRDFLATDDPTADPIAYMLYESENTESSVAEMSAVSALTQIAGPDAAYTLAFVPEAVPPSEGSLYVRHPVPTTLTVPDTWPWPVSAVRADGKVIDPANVWVSKIRTDPPQDGWDYFVNLFDATDALQAYTLIFEGTETSPPVLNFIPDQAGVEGQELIFTVEANDPDGTIPALSATPLPAGATFTDHGDGTGTFVWTPAVGQAGVYSITFEASDGELTDTQQVSLTVTAQVNSYTITATAGPNGSITPSGAVTVEYGADQAFTIAPDEGYHIIDVLVDGEAVD
jgi:hypothetical protein